MSGINSMVYSYGGALLFVAFLAEMRHPWDFWKGMLTAQSFICVVYIFFGAFVYGFYVCVSPRHPCPARLRLQTGISDHDRH